MLRSIPNPMPIVWLKKIQGSAVKISAVKRIRHELLDIAEIIPTPQGIENKFRLFGVLYLSCILVAGTH